MTFPSSNYNRIFLRDYATELSVGLRSHEKHGPQTVIVNVECETAEARRFDDPAEDTLDRTVSYTQVQRFIVTELAPIGHIPLLETVAEMIAAFCFRDPYVAKVRVRLEKPGTPEGAAGAGVELYRVRSNA